jgi:hypothetical protein
MKYLEYEKHMPFGTVEDLSSKIMLQALVVDVQERRISCSDE